jgi:hypothetical protein
MKRNGVGEFSGENRKKRDQKEIEVTGVCVHLNYNDSKCLESSCYGKYLLSVLITINFGINLYLIN